MMKRFDMGLSLAVCFAAMIWGAVAHAEVTGWGVGSHSCGRFIATIGNLPPGEYRSVDPRNDHFVSENTQYQQWLMGFLTGFNFNAFNTAPADDQGQQISGRIDLAGMDLWMRNWCNQHPTESVFHGAAAFIKEVLTNAAAPPPGGTGDTDGRRQFEKLMKELLPGDGYSPPTRDSLKKLIEKPAAK
jgi:hypothetical protein